MDRLLALKTTLNLHLKETRLRKLNDDAKSAGSEHHNEKERHLLEDECVKLNARIKGTFGKALIFMGFSIVCFLGGAIGGLLTVFTPADIP